MTSDEIADLVLVIVAKLGLDHGPDLAQSV